MAKKVKPEIVDFLDKAIVDIIKKEGYADVEPKGTRCEGRRDLHWNEYIINKRPYVEGISVEGKHKDQSKSTAESYERLRAVADYLKTKNIFALVYPSGRMVFRKK